MNEQQVTNRDPRSVAITRKRSSLDEGFRWIPSLSLVGLRRSIGWVVELVASLDAMNSVEFRER